MSSATPSRNKVKKSYANCPAIQLIVRDNKGWRLYKQHHKTGKLSIQSATKLCTDADITFSINGEFFAVLLEEGIQIYESFAGRLVTFVKHYRVRNVYFSPLNNFIVSYHHRRQDDKHGNCWVWTWDQSTSQNDDESKKDESKNNLKVIYQFFLPEFDKKRVPLQFTNDQIIAARITRNAVLIHDVKRLHYKSNNIIGKLDIAKVASVVVAPCRRPSNNNKTKGNNSYLLAVFAMPKNNKAATVTIYEFQYSLAMNKKSNTNKLFTKITQRAFYNVDQCELLWDPSDKSYHHNLLAIASSDVDTSGKSYYGNQTLYLLSSRNNVTVKIPISDQGKLQDVKWSSYGKEFVMIDDHPQKISVFDYRGNTLCSLGQYARNIIRFSNDGRFLWCGGFGNLTGEMTFYDYKQVTNGNNKGQGQCLGYNTDDACRYFEWSPDSSTFLTARLYPYMTVDNGFRIYKYNGHKLCEEKFDRLYQIAYRPSLRNVYPHRSPSPNAQRKAKALPKPPAKKRYVPPHLRPKKKNKTQKNDKSVGNSYKPPKQQHVQPGAKQPGAKQAGAKQPGAQSQPGAQQSVQTNQRQNYQQNSQQNYQQNRQQNYQQNYQPNYQQNQQNQQYGQRQNYYNQHQHQQNQPQQNQNNINYQQQAPQAQNINQDTQNQFNQTNTNNKNAKNDKAVNNKNNNINNNNSAEGDGGGNKKKRKRKRNKNKNKNKQNQDNNNSNNAQGGGSTVSGGFKPGLADNDNRRWARGSKVDPNQ